MRKKILLLHRPKSLPESLVMVFQFLGEEVQPIEIKNITIPTLSPTNYFVVLYSALLTKSQVVAWLKQTGFGDKTPIFAFEEPHSTETGQKSSLEEEAIHWPLHYQEVMDILHQAQRLQAMESANTTPARDIKLFRSLVGMSPNIVRVREMIQQVAQNDVSVLLLGESGTGKEIAARNIHFHSKRKDHPFVAINCGAIPHDLLECELFGYEKGAFTGAIQSYPGRFSMAHGGTLFLDEIGDMPLAMQIKLLRVLQEKTYERLGSKKTETADVRIIAATHRNLALEVQKGSFREDLYYRLNVFPITLTPLRDRREDIPFLVNEISRRLLHDKQTPPRFTEEALNALAQRQWHGNVRELANTIERLSILYPGEMLDAKDLPALESDQEAQPTPSSSFTLPKDPFCLRTHLDTIEKNIIAETLQLHGNVVKRAADHLKIKRTTLIDKIRKYQL